LLKIDFLGENFGFKKEERGIRKEIRINLDIDLIRITIKT
jgi:hypothetical protein